MGGIVGETKYKIGGTHLAEKIIRFKKAYYELLKELTDKQTGELIKGLCAYAYEGKPFITKDDYLKGAFLYVKRELDVSQINSINGKKGAEKLAEKKKARAAILAADMVRVITVRAGNGEKKA